MGTAKLDATDVWGDIFEKLVSYESRTWAEILSNPTRDHPIAVGKLCKEARQRLMDLKLDDVEALFRFRFTGLQRLWGIRDRNVFQVLWWDPEHKVCPSQLRNT